VVIGGGKSARIKKKIKIPDLRKKKKKSLYSKKVTGERRTQVKKAESSLMEE